MRKLLTAAAITGTALVGAVGLSGSAQASGPTGVIKQPATSYTSPSNVAQPVHHLAANTAVETVCFTEGQTLNGNRIWLRIRNDEITSYVHRDSIAPSGDLRHC